MLHLSRVLGSSRSSFALQEQSLVKPLKNCTRTYATFVNKYVRIFNDSQVLINNELSQCQKPKRNAPHGGVFSTSCLMCHQRRNFFNRATKKETGIERFQHESVLVYDGLNALTFGKCYMGACLVYLSSFPAILLYFDCSPTGSVYVDYGMAVPFIIYTIWLFDKFLINNIVHQIHVQAGKCSVFFRRT